jgi:hypothetical protein
VCGCTRVIESGKYARRTTFLYKVAYNLVVEIFDRCPGNLFSNILLLFGFQGQFNEDLLQLLVDIVNTQLLEGVVLRAGLVIFFCIEHL